MEKENSKLYTAADLGREEVDMMESKMQPRAFLLYLKCAVLLVLCMESK